MSPCGCFKVPGTPPSVRRRARSPTARSGLDFPVQQIHDRFKKMTPTGGACPTRASSVYLAAVLQYLTAEVLETGVNFAQDYRFRRVTSRQIQHAIRADQEIDFFVRDTVAWHQQTLLLSPNRKDSDGNDEQEETEAPQPGGSAAGLSPGEEDLREIRAGGKRAPSMDMDVDQDTDDDDYIDDDDDDHFLDVNDNAVDCYDEDTIDRYDDDADERYHNDAYDRFDDDIVYDSDDDYIEGYDDDADDDDDDDDTDDDDYIGDDDDYDVPD